MYQNILTSKLTGLQIRVYMAIYKEAEETNSSVVEMSCRKIADMIKERHPSNVSKSIKRLVREGFIKVIKVGCHDADGMRGTIMEVVSYPQDIHNSGTNNTTSSGTKATGSNLNSNINPMNTTTSTNTTVVQKQQDHVHDLKKEIPEYIILKGTQFLITNGITDINSAIESIINIIRSKGEQIYSPAAYFMKCCENFNIFKKVKTSSILSPAGKKSNHKQSVKSNNNNIKDLCNKVIEKINAGCKYYQDKHGKQLIKNVTEIGISLSHSTLCFKDIPLNCYDNFLNTRLCY